MDSHWYLNESKEIETVQKKWGTEKVICRQPHAAKIMTLKPNFAVSLHLHRYKSETFILIEGTLIVETISREGCTTTIRLSEPYSSITLPELTPHTFYTPDDQTYDTVFIEASTADNPNDSYRIYPSGPRKKPTSNR